MPPLSWRTSVGGFWISPRKHPDFFWAFTSRLLLYLGNSVIAGFTLYLLIDYIGLGRDGAADFQPIMMLFAIPVGLVGLLGSGPLSDRIGRRKIFVSAAALIIAIGLVVPLISPTPVGMIVMTTIMTFGFGVFQSVDTALVSEVLPNKNDYGKDLGIVNLASFIPGVIGPAVGAIIIQQWGYASLFPFAIVFAVLGGLAVFPIKGIR